MMLLAELARQEGLFDWLAAFAVEHARGSPQRLFTLVYAVGTVVTVLFFNDATAVVLTPAVYAATRAAGATPLPYLLVCAFIANAASFALPISNPANLVVFAGRMPHLAAWLGQFALPSVIAVAVDYPALRLTQRRALAAETIVATSARSRLGRRPPALAGIGAATVVALGLLGARRAARIADLGLRRLDDHDRAGIESRVAMAGAQRRVVERAAAGRRLVRSGRGARSHRRDRRARRDARRPKSHRQARPRHGAPASSSRWPGT